MLVVLHKECRGVAELVNNRGTLLAGGSEKCLGRQRGKGFHIRVPLFNKTTRCARAFAFCESQNILLR